MKNYGIRFLVLLSLVFGLVGCGSPLTGRLVVNENENISVRDEKGNRINLLSGPSSVEFVSGSWSQNIKIMNLENNGKHIKIEIPNSAFKHSSDFAARAKDINQDFDLEATKQSKPVGNLRFEKGLASCSYAGYCSSCGFSFDGKYDCGKLRFKYNCLGTQSALISKQDFQEITSIIFSKNDQVLGVFTAAGKTYSRSKIESVNGPCF